MRSIEEQTKIVGKALDLCRDRLTPEQIEDLEHCYAELRCPLLKAARGLFMRGEVEAGAVLGIAHVYKFARFSGAPVESVVVYCRISSWGQAKGMGLWRQLDTCQRFARERNLSIIGAFSEVASGDGPLPVRAQAQRMAEMQGCNLLCEDYSRWSRKGASDVPPDYVVMTSEAERQIDEAVRKAFNPFQLRVLAGGMARMEENALAEAAGTN